MPSISAGVRKSVILKENTNDPDLPWPWVYEGTNHKWFNDISCDVIGVDEEGQSIYRFIAVGNDNQIVTSSSGEKYSWTDPTYGSGEYRAVIWDNYHEINQYILVGDNGLLVSGTPGSWVTHTTGSSANLKGVTIRWEN